tara:strand:+ start:175 stop:909 length:735 start_codon:yes stop_codon:yes gene_type:complete
MVEFKLKVIKECESSNTYLLNLAKKGCAEGVSILTMKQSNGKGTRNNKWISNNGNLFLSTFIRPKVHSSHWSEISIILGLSLYQYLLSLGIDKSLVKIKWPNDILIKYKKISGILVEVSNNFCIIGIGLNVQSAPLKIDTGKDTICLRELINTKNLNLQEMSNSILKIFYNNYNIWSHYSLKPFHKKINEILAYLNYTIRFVYDNTMCSGKIVGINYLGNLKVLTFNNEYLYLSSSETIVYEGL